MKDISAFLEEFNKEEEEFLLKEDKHNKFKMVYALLIWLFKEKLMCPQQTVQK